MKKLRMAFSLFMLVFTITLISPASAWWPPAQVKFTASPLTGTSPLEVQFMNHSGAPFTTFNWCYGDGTQDIFEHTWQDKVHPSHIYDIPGSYSPLLQVMTRNYQAPDIIYIIPEYIYVDAAYAQLPLTAGTENTPTYFKCGWENLVDGDPFSWVSAEFNKEEPVPATGEFSFSNGSIGTIHKIRLLPVGVKINFTHLSILEPFEPWEPFLPDCEDNSKIRDKALQDDINISLGGDILPFFIGDLKQLTGKRYLTNLAKEITIEASLDGENWDVVHTGQIDLSPSPQEVTLAVVEEFMEQGGFFSMFDAPDKKQQDKIATPEFSIKEFVSPTPLFNFSRSYGLWKTIELETPVTAKYIRIGLNDPIGAHASYIELAEIQIFGETGTEVIAKNNEFESDIMSNTFELAQNYPNPFNPSTEISFNLPEDASVTVEIFNVRGEKVSELLNSNMAAGVHQLMWNAQNNSGMNLASGTYYCRFTAKTATQHISQTRKMLYLR